MLKRAIVLIMLGMMIASAAPTAVAHASACEPFVTGACRTIVDIDGCHQHLPNPRIACT